MGNGHDATLAIDFGTSNSAVASFADGRLRRIQMEDGADTLPTAVFFDFDSREIHVGTKANKCLTQGIEGRYMRSLKRVLGTPLMAEKRYIMGQKLDFFDIISGYLSELKARAERIEGKEFRRVLSGRPVHFHNNPAKDQQARNDLQECYHRAGFAEVAFLFEPEAAAIASAVVEHDFSLGLIVDIGGGTSDYSVFRGQRNTKGHSLEICASHGHRLGGTDFDKKLNTTYFMPTLGKGASLRNVMGKGTSAAPVAIFNDLATWEKIPFLYTPETLQHARELARDALDPAPFLRLLDVLNYELGHELAVLAEQAKIAVNQTDTPQTTVDLSLLEKGQTVTIPRRDFVNVMQGHRAQIIADVHQTLRLAGQSADDVTDVIFVGGSSLMTFVHDALHEALPAATHHTSPVFTAVVDGLAMASDGSAHVQPVYCTRT